MAGETWQTIVGNLTADPELRYTQNGLPVVSFTVAATEKVWDRTAGQAKDGDSLFMRCNAWREMAEHIAGSLTKGTRVIVYGKLRTRQYQDREGNNRSSIELEVDAIGPDLRWATAAVTRAGSAQGGGTDWGSVNRQRQAPPHQEQDAWTTPPAAGNNATWATAPLGDDTPF